MYRPLGHIGLPALATLAIFALYLTPVGVFGCVGRGLLALGVVLLSLLAGFASVSIAIRGRMRNDPGTGWWIASASILLIPALLILGPLG